MPERDGDSDIGADGRKGGVFVWEFGCMGVWEELGTMLFPSQKLFGKSVGRRGAEKDHAQPRMTLPNSF